jgi:glucan 1,3-beta-glucosidase
VAQVYARMQQAIPGKRVMIGETGWPSAGRPRRAARATLVNEARYLRGFLAYAARAHMPYNVIEAFDQPWKRAQEGTVGGYWGIFDVDARPKFPMAGPVIEEPHWWWGWLAGAMGALLFGFAGVRMRARGIGALLLGGFAVGAALAWQGRQMFFACRDLVEWSVSIAACAAACGTAWWLARAFAGRLAGGEPGKPAPAWLRLGWLFGLAWYDLLLVFDGRYRDFPLGLFALPCVGYALAGWLCARPARPPAEHRLLASALPLLGVLVVVQEAGLSLTAWLWLGLNLALALPVLLAWRTTRLRAQQA